MEYIDSIPCRGGISHYPTHTKKKKKKEKGCVLSTTLNSIWRCGSISGDLESVEYLSINNTPKSTHQNYK